MHLLRYVVRPFPQGAKEWERVLFVTSSDGNLYDRGRGKPLSADLCSFYERCQADGLIHKIEGDVSIEAGECVWVSPDNRVYVARDDGDQRAELENPPLGKREIAVPPMRRS